MGGRITAESDHLVDADLSRRIAWLAQDVRTVVRRSGVTGSAEAAGLAVYCPVRGGRPCERCGVADGALRGSALRAGCCSSGAWCGCGGGGRGQQGGRRPHEMSRDDFLARASVGETQDNSSIRTASAANLGANKKRGRTCLVEMEWDRERFDRGAQFTRGFSVPGYQSGGRRFGGSFRRGRARQAAASADSGTCFCHRPAGWGRSGVAGTAGAANESSSNESADALRAGWTVSSNDWNNWTAARRRKADRPPGGRQDGRTALPPACGSRGERGERHHEDRIFNIGQ